MDDDFGVRVGWEQSNLETLDFLLSRTFRLRDSLSSSTASSPPSSSNESRPRVIESNRRAPPVHRHGHGAIFAPYLKKAAKQPKQANEIHDDDDDATSEGSRTSVLMELKDDIRTKDVLKFFWKHDVGIAQIESRPVSNDDGIGTKFEFFVEFQGEVGDTNVYSLLRELKSTAGKLRLLDEKEGRR